MLRISQIGAKICVFFLDNFLFVNYDSTMIR
jgi:hypothetical protein